MVADLGLGLAGLIEAHTVDRVYNRCLGSDHSSHGVRVMESG